MTDKKFDPRKSNKLNNPNRFKMIPIEIIEKELNLKDPTNLVDYGAGTGFFTAEIAELYPKARIFALDIESQMVDYINENIDTTNIFPLEIEDNQMPFTENDIDAVWSIAVYHEMKNPEKWLRNVYRTLKPGGKLLIIDWARNQNPEFKAGPPIEHRVDENLVIDTLKAQNFKNIGQIIGLLNHFGIIAEK